MRKILLGLGLIIVASTAFAERMISKDDTDRIFSLGRTQWEFYAPRMVHPTGWEVRVMSHETGSQVAARDPATGFYLSIQPFYTDNEKPPRMLLVGSWYPVGSGLVFDDEFKRKVEAGARNNLGKSYVVRALFKKMGAHEGVELMITQSSSKKSERPGTRSMAQTTMEVVDGWCVQNHQDFSAIDRTAKVLGAKKLPDDIAQADPALRSMGGGSYVVVHEGSAFIVAYASDGGCTVVAKDIEHDRLKALLNKNYKLKLMHTESAGIQVQEIYQFVDSSIYEGGIISLVYGKPETGFKEGSIGFIPAATWKKMRNK